MQVPFMNNITKIIRHELYEQVWTLPMSRLAKQYGLSDVGLAKICKRHNIVRINELMELLPAAERA